MASNIKIGYLDEEFRKTKIGRSKSTQNKYLEYQKQLAERMSVPSKYLKAADAIIKKQGKTDPVMASVMQPKARGKGVYADPEAAIRNAEIAGYSSAGAQGIVRRAAGKTTGTLLGG